MRYLTPLGWERLKNGFEDKSLPLGDETQFWTWAMAQGDAFRLAAYLIVGMLGGGESSFKGFNRIAKNAHPVRMAWALDDRRKAIIADFLMNSSDFMK